MDFREILDVGTLRAVSEPIDRILLAFIRLFSTIFKSGDGFLKLLINTIVGQPFLLISVSILLIGFVIGIIKRLISV